jgi:carboxyl-terminal processing protease
MTNVFRISIFLFWCTSSLTGFCQTTTCEKAERLVAKLKEHHIRPLPVNDEWSQRVFDNFFITLDPAKIYFTAEDIQSLKEFSTLLDDDLAGKKTCSFVNAVSVLLKRKIANYTIWVEGSLNKPFNYSEKETFDAARLHALIFVASERDLQIRWKSFLKYQILSRMNQESLADSTGRSLLSFEPAARQKIKNKELSSCNNFLKNGFEKHLSHAFLQAIASTYDPHSAYFSFEENEEFNSQLSQTDLAFGFSLTEDRFGSVRFSSIVPGSPAWNSNDIHEDDLLISIEPSGKPVMNAMDFSLDELEAVLEDYATLKATFIVKKKDGKVEEITLAKEKIQSVENTVSGIVLKGTKTIGYIALPSFYFDRKNEAGSNGCANDVAKAIIKLNREKIEGLILDLRFNGGGSLGEALGLAGIFIDYGPFATYSESGQPLITLKDQNKGTIYNGPLMLLVNGFSASASELLAAILQDYNRALIVGSRTFGKATGQDIYPITPAPEKGDYVKVTEVRLYRANGKSYQHSGVIPDILLPDITDIYDLRESQYPYALPSDSISKKLIYTPLISLPVKSLKEKSTFRISQSEHFKRVEFARTTLLSPVPLDIISYENYLDQLKDFNKSEAASFSVHNTNFDSALYAVDAFKKKMNDTLLSEIESSIYIQEAYQIMNDFITLQKK